MEGTRVPTSLGSAAAGILGLLYVVVGATYFALPEEQRTGGGEALLTSLTEQSGVYRLQGWAFVLVGVLGIAVVAAVSDLLRDHDREWLRLASALAYLGFAITVVDSLRETLVVPDLAEHFVEGDEAVQAAIIGAVGTLSLDSDGLLGFGAIGLWVLVAAVVGLRSRHLPTPLGAIGVAVALAYWLVVLGIFVEQDVLIGVAAGLGGVILAPVFYIWLGMVLCGPVQTSATEEPVS